MDLVWRNKYTWVSLIVVGLGLTALVATITILAIRGTNHANANATEGCLDGFHLTQDVYVHRCINVGREVYDIRHFANQNPTIKGIQLNKEQWLKLGLYAKWWNKRGSDINHG